jgi:spore coat polysaccharide biosynthesis protein SpsF
MKVVAIIQARMSSTRLPGKVLLDIQGRSVLEHIHLRLQSCQYVDQVLVATSDHHSDDLIFDWGKKENISIYRGSLSDVLSRYYFAASEVQADVVIRITGDCPLIDPDIVDELVQILISKNYDYASLVGDFPDGLDCSVMTFKALEEAHLKAKLHSEREHVCPYIEKTFDDFKIFKYYKFDKLGHHRWTLDEEEDYELIKIIYQKLYRNNNIFKHDEILALLAKEPSISELNSHIIRNEGYLKSLAHDEDHSLQAHVSSKKQ